MNKNNAQNNSLMEIQQRYKNKNVNLLLPVSNEAQINPFYKFTVMEVTADTKENSGDVFKVGRAKVGTNAKGDDIYAEVFSPAKPLLMKLASAAGIQFDPNNTYGEYVSKNCYRAKAYGAMRMPDGTGKTHVDEKVINLDDEEDRFRLEFMDKSLEGISDKRAAEEAAKLFKGEWVKVTNKWGNEVKAYRIADSDRQRYIDRAVLVNMTLLRKTFAEKAMTGAILRVIRALIGLKGTYTKQELEKPFVIPRVTFSPDYSNPEVRRAMLEQGMSSVNNMFGSARQLGTPSYSGSGEHDRHTETFDAEEFADNAAFASDQTDAMDQEQPEPQQQDEPEDTPFGDPNDTPFDEPSEFGDDPLICSECGDGISEKVKDYSTKRHGRPLCMNCQKAVGQ